MEAPFTLEGELRQRALLYLTGHIGHLLMLRLYLTPKVLVGPYGLLCALLGSLPHVGLHDIQQGLTEAMSGVRATGELLSELVSARQVTLRLVEDSTETLGGALDHLFRIQILKEAWERASLDMEPPLLQPRRQLAPCRRLP